MRKYALRFSMLSLLATACTSLTGSSQADEFYYLVDELSRADLSMFALLQFDGDRELPRHFKFPDHVKPGQVWGIDVSHHQGRIDWTDVPDQGVFFAYMKASQGKRFKDRQFGRNWIAVNELRNQGKKIHRGAYHFLSAGFSGAEQAKLFIEQVGKLEGADMPACLDMEWDFEVRDGRVVTDASGNAIDRWAGLSSEEIVQKALSWLEAVEQGTGKQPIIYTNAHWWQQRIGESKKLSKYKIWIADYSRRSLTAEKPREINGHQWAIWQLTDRGFAAGVGGNVDTNRFRTNESDFYSEFNITQ